jgi:aryl-alcohol dehydrogenase-like predicted oxidoreductase
MLRRKFGNTDLEVSVISLGCWIFGVDWWGHRTQEDCNQMCSFSFDQGITFFDNGDAYGNGRAEELFGQWMKDAKIDRSKIEIGGKVGYDFYSDPGEAGSHRERKQDFSPKFVRFSLEQALKRLGTDYIDLYMAHNIKLPQFRDDLFAELEKIKDEGKIRQWGVSLGPAIGWREEGFKAMADHGAKAVQTVYNLFEQAPGREFCEMARAVGAGVLARVHDNSSILKDKVKINTEIGANDHRKFRDDNWKVYGLQKLEKVRPLAAKYGVHVHTLACKWLLMDPALTSITGTLLDETEIKEAVAACDMPDLTKQEMLDLADNYARDFNLGDPAHPCDLKSSIDASGRVRSGYVPPPVLIA